MISLGEQNIFIPGAVLPRFISIFDSMGNEVKRFKAAEIQGLDSNITVGTDGLPQGLYFIRMTGKNGNITAPFIISGQT